MSYDIQLVKLVNGDMVLGKWNPQENKITDPATLQMMPTQQGGVQMMLLPFGYPIDNEVSGEIEGRHIMYFYKKIPDELKSKYMEASSNLTLSGANDLKNLGNMGGGEGQNMTDLGSLFKK